jgi:hypothetical protein
MIKLPEMPPRIARLPRDSRGYPIPWFVHWEDGVPDFRVIGLGKWAAAARFERCWICGDPRGRNFTFVAGPMGTITRVNGEPPCHADCALFAAKACPFLARPRMRRNEKDLPDHVESPLMALHNPGVCALWETRSFRAIRGLASEPLAVMGPPTGVLWFTGGREADRATVQEALKEALLRLEQNAHDRAPSNDAFVAARVELNNGFARALELAPP